MRRSIFLFSLLLSASVSSAATIEIPRTDGSTIRFYFEKPVSVSFPILVVLQGSTCVSVQPVIQMVAATALSKGVGVVGVEKYGLNETTISCPKEYLARNTVNQRIVAIFMGIGKAFFSRGRQIFRHRNFMSR